MVCSSIKLCCSIIPCISFGALPKGYVPKYNEQLLKIAEMSGSNTGSSFTQLSFLASFKKNQSVEQNIEQVLESVVGYEENYPDVPFLYSTQ